MKLVLALAAVAAVGAPIAHAQEGQQPALGSMRLLSPTPVPTPAPTPAVVTPVEPAPAAAPAAATPAEPAPIATPVSAPVAAPAAAAAASGWAGPVNFSPVAIADLIRSVCRASVSGDGGDLTAHASQLGLGPSQPPHADLARALPPGAVTWRVPTVDGVVYLYGYGEEPLNCGAAIVRPLAEDGFRKVFDLLQGSDFGFATETTQTLPGGVNWMRLKSPQGEFVDMMEYPSNEELPGILRADYLPG